jgi:hypothetical protein
MDFRDDDDDDVRRDKYGRGLFVSVPGLGILCRLESMMLIALFPEEREYDT